MLIQANLITALLVVTAPPLAGVRDVPVAGPTETAPPTGQSHESLQSIVRRARAAVDGENWAAARTSWLQAYAADRRATDAALWIGYVEMRAEHPERALNWLAEAQATRPEDWRAPYYAALCSLAMDDPRGAREALRATVQVAEDVGVAWTMLARVEHQLNERELARNAAHRAIGVNPGDPRPHRLLGQLEIERRRFGAAAGYFVDALELAPGDIAAIAGLASAYRAAERTRKTATRHGSELRAELDQKILAALRRSDVDVSLVAALCAMVRFEQGDLQAAARLAGLAATKPTAVSLSVRAFVAVETGSPEAAAFLGAALRVADGELEHTLKLVAARD